MKQYDEKNVRKLQNLYDALQREEFPFIEEPNKTDAAYRNFAFFESYFSNLKSSESFTLEEAQEVIRTQKPLPADRRMYHDILGTYRITSDKEEMCRTPKTYEELIDILLYRHSIVMAAIPERRPGMLKTEDNSACNVAFVDHDMVLGTLEKEFELYKQLESPLKRAIFMLGMILNVHPFTDGNGRMARLMMNAELVSAGQCKIMIPLVYRHEYGQAVMLQSTDGNPAGLISLMTRLQRFSASITGEDYTATRDYLKSCNAFKTYRELILEEPEEGYFPEAKIPEWQTYDERCIQKLGTLYNALTKEDFPYIEEQNKTDAAYRNFAFFESYFSNCKIGEVHTIEDSLEAIRTGQPQPDPNNAAHDIIGTYRITSDREEMCRTPKTSEEFIDILLHRHSIVMAARPSRRPGQFKNMNNHAGWTVFVDHRLVRGTLQRAFEYYLQLQSPFAKALYMMGMIIDIHPFNDGNGRISRLMMNAEMVSSGQSKIMIPKLFRSEYVQAQRRFSQRWDPSALITKIPRVRRFSAKITGDDFDATRAYLERCNAFKTVFELINDKNSLNNKP